MENKTKSAYYVSSINEMFQGIEPGTLMKIIGVKFLPCDDGTHVLCYEIRDDRGNSKFIKIYDEQDHEIVSL